MFHFCVQNVPLVALQTSIAYRTVNSDVCEESCGEKELCGVKIKEEATEDVSAAIRNDKRERASTAARPVSISRHNEFSYVINPLLSYVTRFHHPRYATSRLVSFYVLMKPNRVFTYINFFM